MGLKFVLSNKKFIDKIKEGQAGITSKPVTLECLQFSSLNGTVAQW